MRLLDECAGGDVGRRRRSARRPDSLDGGHDQRPALSDADEFIVATEVGILHRLRRENPSKRFFAANDRASCAYMKVTTLPKVRAALIHGQHRITVPAEVADRARLAIERMVAIGGGARQPLSPASDGVDPGE
jgi:quinolinate synthase